MDRNCSALMESKRFVDNHFREPITIHDVSRFSGYTPYHLNFLFEKFYGETFASYLRKVRLSASLKDLRSGESVSSVAKSLSYGSADGFSRAFRARYGISPLQYSRGESVKNCAVAEYEFCSGDGAWGSGANPTPDGLWEYGYYNPETKEYRLMNWMGTQFEAPYQKPNYSDPSWYCLNRSRGCGMHPGKKIQAVRTFICPHDGTVEVFLSVGRVSRVYLGRQPGFVQLYQNDTPISSKETGILTSTFPILLKKTCQVKKGDRIRLHLDSMGDIRRMALYLYVQRFSYTEITDPNLA